jgi:hypothetical protein
MTTSKPRWFILAPVLALVFLGVAAVAFSLGATSGGSASRPGQPTTIPGRPELGPGWTAPSTNGGVSGPAVITIAKIDGSKLSIQTTDGWTRTIDATGATITKGRQNMAVSDLKVGDRITFREARQSDGTYKIAAIQVLTPTPAAKPTPAPTAAVRRAAVTGTVASKTATSIVVTAMGGKTVTVNVSSTTRYSVRGVARPTLDDVAVGARITAQGTLNSDGSIAATVVQAFPNIQPGGKRGSPLPKPSASASAPNI